MTASRDDAEPTFDLSPLQLIVDNFISQLSSGSRPRIEEFLNTQSGEQRRWLFEHLLAVEVKFRQANGELPTQADYRQRFPELSDSIASCISGGTRNHAADETIDPSAKPALKSEPSGTRFGDYVLLDEIARGGMGVVYKARQESLGRVVALKMILAGQLASEDEVERFYAEARAAAALKHAAILPIYEINQHEDRHYFTMEYVDGGGLDSRLREGPMSPYDAARIVRDVARGVQFAHDNGIIHRDLKPANVLLDKDDNPFVADFGLAKRLNVGAGLTATGQILGTPSYMSPEQAGGASDNVTASSDVYALGAVLFATLTGKPPFAGESAVAVLSDVVNEEAPSPRTLRPGVPVDLATLCERCMVKLPSGRLPSAGMLADELDRFLNGEPIQSRPIRRTERIWRWCRRKPWAVGVVSATAIALVAIALAVVTINRAGRTREIAELSDRIDSTLQNNDWTPDNVDRLQGLIGQLRELDAARAEASDNQLDSALKQHLDRLLRKPNISSSDVPYINIAVDLLVSRSADPDTDRSALESRVQRRLRIWSTIIDIKAPYEEYLDNITQGEKVENGFMAPATPDANGRARRMVVTNVGCDGNTRVEAEFQLGWDDVPILGIVINGGTDAAYQFVMQKIVGPARGREDSDDQRRLSIYREQTRIVEQPIDIGPLKSDVLTMTAERRGDELTFQINQQKPVTLRDLFPTSDDKIGVVAVYAPRDTVLRRLAVSRQSLPSERRPLEEGDALFGRGNYREAAASYQSQAIVAEDETLVQEALFKAGLCLVQLQRHDEAADLFEQVLEASGAGQSPWNARAASQMWLLHLNADRQEEANLILESLAGQHTFEQLTTIIPPDVRDRILDAYEASGSSGGVSAIRNNPNRVRDLERAVRVYDLLNADSEARFDVRDALAKAFLRDGRPAEAKTILDEMGQLDALGYWEHDMIVSSYIWATSGLGSADEALALINRIMKSADLEKEPRYERLLVERARVHMLLGQPQEARTDLERVMKASEEVRTPGIEVATAIQLGFLYEDAGDSEAAQQLWTAAYQRSKDAGGVHYLPTTMIGSLANAISVEDTEAIVVGVAGENVKTPYFRYLQNRFIPQSMVRSVLNNMWRSKRGKEAARNIVFRKCTYFESIYLQTIMVGNEVCRQGMLNSEELLELPDDVDKLINEFSLYTFEEYSSGRINEAHFVRFALTWKGTMGFLGWGGLKTIDARPRCRIAYVFAHHYSKKYNRHDDARKLLETAINESEPNSDVNRLAREALAKLDRDGKL